MRETKALHNGCINRRGSSFNRVHCQLIGLRWFTDHIPYSERIWLYTPGRSNQYYFIPLVTQFQSVESVYCRFEAR